MLFRSEILQSLWLTNGDEDLEVTSTCSLQQVIQIYFGINATAIKK